MLKVSRNQFPLQNVQRVQSSEGAGSSHAPDNNERVSFILDPVSIPMFDPHSSYLTCDFELDGNQVCQMSFVNQVGCLAMILNMRVYLGGTLVEEMSDFPTLCNVAKVYNRELSQVKLNSLGELGAGVSNPLQESAATGKGSRVVKLCFQLPTGLLTQSKAIPLLATGKCRVEFDLEKAEKCLVPSKYNVIDNDIGGTDYGEAHLGAIRIQALGTPTTYWDLEQVTDATLDGYADFTDQHDCPFFVGCYIAVTKQTGAGAETVVLTGRQVTGITKDTGTPATEGNIRLTFAAQNTSADVILDDVCRIRMLTYSDNTAVVKGSYSISNVEFHARVIQPPPNYVAALPKVMTSGMSFDVATYTSFKDNLPNLTSGTVNIPVYSHRSLSVVCVHRSQTQTDYANTLNGQYAQLTDYQFQLGVSGRRVPNRPVSCSIMNTADAKPSQEHIRELAKGLSRNSVVRDVRGHKTNFVIARSLGSKGATMDLSGSGGCRLYVNYAAASGNLQFNNYVHHIRTVNVSNEGVEVLV